MQTILICSCLLGPDYPKKQEICFPSFVVLQDSFPFWVSVLVINTTQHQGLASKATDMLSTAGFQTQEPANADVEYTGKVRITAGPNAVDDAYSVARFFPGAHVRLTDAQDSTVTVELGTFYDDAMSAEDVQRVLKSTDPVEQPAKCRPMSGTQQD